jgi:Uma2 family endonuclease
MTELIETENEVLEDEVRDMPSKNHSFTMGTITGLLFNDERFTVMPELSLDTSPIDLSQFNLKAKEELIPDICVYRELPDEPGDELDNDILRMTQMPELAIEILSPKQGIDDILLKFKAYFALGIKSCWLVIPSVKVIKIYSAQGNKIFDIQHDTQLVDDIMDIRLPIQSIFGKRTTI